MKITTVRLLDGFRVHLRFDDGTEGELDLSDLAGKGVFAAWSDRAVFERVEIDEGGGLSWPGSGDLCPDALYIRLTGKPVEEVLDRMTVAESNA